MLERSEPILKFVCLVLAGLVLYQASRLFASPDPLRNVRVPSLSSAIKESEAPSDPKKATNAPPNPEAAKKTEQATTNAPPRAGLAGPMRSARGSAMPPRRDSGSAAANLPPAVQARIEQIKESEILGPVIRPMPMALLGIAGRDAFLRAPDGQTGLVREGAELGGIKLLRIGTNRVLIEHEGQQKELTVFSGFGSGSLLPPKGKDNPK